MRPLLIIKQTLHLEEQLNLRKEKEEDGEIMPELEQIQKDQKLLNHQMGD